jgi:phytoene synthase
MPGEIRLQWWRDVLEGGAASAGAGNPVAEKLGEAIEDYGLPMATLVNMADARIFDLYSDPMPSRTDLEGYCGETNAAPIQLALLILDPENAAANAETSGHAGCALGIARILLSLPQQRRKGQCYVPQEMLAAAGLKPENFASGEAGAGHWRAVETMIALGRQHFSEFRKRAGGISPAAQPAYLPVSSVPHMFKAIENAKLSVFETPPLVSPIRRQWAILRRAIGGW